MSSDFGDMPFQGARLLGGDSPGLVPTEPTSHITVLRNTAFQLDIMAQKGFVIGYQMVLRDQGENHSYIFRFGDDIRNAIKEMFSEMPKVGEALPEEEENA